jgi:hypothetical protein
VAYNWTTEWPGVYARHDANCQLRNGGDCTCAQVTYRASAKAPDGHSRLLSPDFPSAIEARDWLRDQRARLTAAIAVADEGPSVANVIQDFLAAAAGGNARARNGDEYTPARLAQIRGGLAYVEAEMGDKPLQAVRRRHVQSLIDELHAAGLSSDRIVEVVSTFRDLFVYAIQRDIVDFNPIVQLRLPVDDGSRADQPTVATAPYTYAAQANNNGNGNHAASAPAPQAVATEPVPVAHGAAESDEPFDDEPTYGPGMPAPDDSRQAPPVPLPPPVQPVSTEQLPPVSGPTMGMPFTPPPTPAAGYPHDTGPMFAAPETRMITPLGAETHYGTPTYGAQSLPMQPTVQAPKQGDEDGVFMSEQMFWWITRIVVIVFVLIALVLAAESV